jgi:hypothetical protein
MRGIPGSHCLCTVVVTWCPDFYNSRRRHSSAGLQSPDHYKKTAEQPAVA